jgi:hypothetical protein
MESNAESALGGHEQSNSPSLIPPAVHVTLTVIESIPEEMGRLLVASMQDASPSIEAIKQAVQNQIVVPGAEVYRGDHLRVA